MIPVDLRCTVVRNNNFTCPNRYHAEVGSMIVPMVNNNWREPGYYLHEPMTGAKMCIEHIRLLTSIVPEPMPVHEDTIDIDDVPIVTPGTKILIQLKDGRSWIKDASGKSVERRNPCTPVQVTVRNMSDCCEADDTNREDEPYICPDCIDSWSIDYYISLGETPAYFRI